jgi:hypothetical protein
MVSGKTEGARYALIPASVPRPEGQPDPANPIGKK